jgi:hypothetical protein
MNKMNSNEHNKTLQARRPGHYCHKEYAMALTNRSERVRRYLVLINSTFSKLFIDDNFITLLRAESMTDIPIYLKPVFEKARRRADALG